MDCCEDRASLGNAYIAVDWDPTALHLRYQTSQERVRDRHQQAFLQHKLEGHLTNHAADCVPVCVCV